MYLWCICVYVCVVCVCMCISVVCVCGVCGICVWRVCVYLWSVCSVYVSVWHVCVVCVSVVCVRVHVCVIFHGHKVVADDTGQDITSVFGEKSDPDKEKQQDSIRLNPERCPFISEWGGRAFQTQEQRQAEADMSSMPGRRGPGQNSTRGLISGTGPGVPRD